MVLQGFECILCEGMCFDLVISECCFMLLMCDVLEVMLLLLFMVVIVKEVLCIDVIIVCGDCWQLEIELLVGIIDVVVDILLLVFLVIWYVLLLIDLMVVLVCFGYFIVNELLMLECYFVCEYVYVLLWCCGVGLEDVELCCFGYEWCVWLCCQYYLVVCCVVSCMDLFVMLLICYVCIVNELYGNVMLLLLFNVQLFELYLYWYINSDQDVVSCWLCDYVFVVMVEVVLDDVVVVFVDGC